MELEYIIYFSIRERQLPFDFTHMWNLRNKIDEHMGSREKGERETNHKRLSMIENKLRVGGIRWVGNGPLG